ncbi:hypothetical protein F5Y12DRAFT_429791 [Xylaria sp. FL1777]|nr:hypothetical protein F5Y12DRAFT_429791 [Xylaria sp. FL1777]
MQRHVQWPSERRSNLAHVHVLQCRIAWIHFYARHYEEATTLVLQILSDPLANTGVIGGCGCYDILYEIAIAENKHDVALDMLRKAVKTSVGGYRYAHYLTTTKMARLKSYLRSRGCLEEADKVRMDSEYLNGLYSYLRDCEKNERYKNVVFGSLGYE